MARTVKLGVLISGSGTNLQAIIEAIEARRLDAEIRTVVSNKPEAYGLVRARQHGIPARILEHRGFPSREAYDRVLIEHLHANDVELVILAGFMRLLSPVFIRSFRNRIMNIHPALLPAFPGLRVQAKAVEYGVRFSGCTVHFVNEECDEGPIIVQAVVPVMPDDTEESLSQRILLQEHRIYPMAIRLYGEGRLEVEGRRVRVKDGKADGGLAWINPLPAAD